MYPNIGLVGIMVASQKEKKHILKKYLDNNRTRIRLYCFTPSDIDWKRKSIIGLHRSNQKWALKKFPFPQVIYNRCYKIDRKIIKDLEAVIGRNSCFNHVNQFNKLETYLKLREWLVPHLPETVPYSKENVVLLLIIHKVLYFKPCCGNQGKGVYRVQLMDSGEIHIAYHHFLPQIIVWDFIPFLECMEQYLGSNAYIVQKGVDVQKINDRNFDIRVLVQKNRKGLWSITNIVSRICQNGCYNTSIYEEVCYTEKILQQLYPSETVNNILQLIHNLSLRTAEIMESHAGYHLGEICVDFALDKVGHVWIIEVNGKPQKSIYNAFKEQHRVYQRPLEYAHYLCRR